MKIWKECSYRHKLEYLDGLRSFEGNEFTAFGTAIHSYCESALVKEVKNPSELFQGEFVKEVEKPINKKDLLDNYTKILILLNPFIPHFSNECLEKISSQEKIHWPDFDKNELIEENINYVIQINGKKKSMLIKKRDLNEEEILKVIKNHEQIKKLIDKKIIKKTIFIKNRLINFII
jgi:leucyl-tRNA synthetase